MNPLFAYKIRPGAPPEQFLGMVMVSWAPTLWMFCCFLAITSLVLTCVVQRRPRFTAGCIAFVIFHPYLLLSTSGGDGGHFQCDASWLLLPYPVTLVLVQLVLTFSSRPAPTQHE